MSDQGTYPSSEDAWAERMAGDLHDGLVQWLVGAKMQAEAIRGNHRDGRPISARSLESLVDSLQSGLIEARRLLRGLHGPEVTDGLWHQALRKDLLQSAQSIGAGQPAATGGVAELEIDLDADTEPLSEASAATVYRLLREATWNALRHAQAKKIRLSARRTDDRLVLIVVDDGKGFDPQRVATDRFGVSGMMARVRRAGGTASLTTALGNGTRYEFQVPIAGL